MASDIATILFEELDLDDVLKSSLQIICSLVFFFWSGNDTGVLKQIWSGQLVWVVTHEYFIILFWTNQCFSSAIAWFKTEGDWVLVRVFWDY